MLILLKLAYETFLYYSKLSSPPIGVTQFLSCTAYLFCILLSRINHIEFFIMFILSLLYSESSLRSEIALYFS